MKKNIVLTKIISIKSRGRFVHKNGVIYGPTRHFYQENTNVIRELFTKYPAIEIAEKVKDGSIVMLNPANVDTDNYRGPVSMMEQKGDNTNKKEFVTPEIVPVDNDTSDEEIATPSVSVEKTPVVEVIKSEENTTEVVMDKEVSDEKESKMDMVEDTTSEAVEVQEVEKTEVVMDKENVTKEDTPKVEPQTNNQNANQKNNKNKSNNQNANQSKNKNKSNKGASSIEVKPEEA